MTRSTPARAASRHVRWSRCGAGTLVLVAVLLGTACTGSARPTGSASAAARGSRSPAGSPRAGTSRSPSPATDLDGLIAYTMSGDIWVMNADGSSRRQVTTAGGNDFDPSFSPEGKRIVFRTSRGRYATDPNGTGVEGIFVIDVDGTHEHEIQPPHGGLFPDWSPRGGRIALSTLRATDRTEAIVTMDPDGTHVLDTGVVGGECSEWSPDGSKIAYCHRPGNGQFDVWVMNADGSHRRRLTTAIGNDHPGAWSPDGHRIAFASQRDGSYDVFVMNADGTGQRRLTRTADQESPVAWLADGRIVYASFHGEEAAPHYYLMDADGANVRSLPQLEGAGDPIDWWQPR